MKLSIDNLPSKIVQRRIALGMTQLTLSKLTGIPVAAVSHYEDGRRVPGVRNLIKLAHHLQTTFQWVLS